MLGAPPNFYCVTRLSSLFKADVLLAVTSLQPKETVRKEINSEFPKPTVLLKGRNQWCSAVLQGSLRASFHFLSKEFFIRHKCKMSNRTPVLGWPSPPGHRACPGVWLITPSDYLTLFCVVVGLVCLPSFFLFSLSPSFSPERRNMKLGKREGAG